MVDGDVTCLSSSTDPTYAFSDLSNYPLFALLAASSAPRFGGRVGIDVFDHSLRVAIDRGMPFIGWAINADSRKIAGKAQPGEDHFIKYLGRDFDALV